LKWEGNVNSFPPFVESAKGEAPGKSKAGQRQVNYRMRCPNGLIADAELSLRGSALAIGGRPACPLSEHEILRLRLTVKDWFRLME
jgi:hypothetical protein